MSSGKGTRLPITLLILCVFGTLSDGQSSDQEVQIGSAADCEGAQQRNEKLDGVLIFPPESSAKPYYTPNCRWTLTIDSATVERPLELKFLHFNLGNGDSVKITDKQFGGAYNVEFAYANAPTGDPIAGFTKAIQIIFVSDGDTSYGTGFKISWYPTPVTETTPTTTKAGLPEETVFRVVLRGSEYPLTTPNYPGDYPNSKSLYWVLTAAESRDRIKLMFNEFKLALQDYIVIYNGIEPEDEFELVKYTGATTTPKNVISPSNQVLVFFKSDQFVSNKGFSITYKIFGVATEGTDTNEEDAISNKKLKEKTPLSTETRAVIIVVSCLALLVIIIISVYCIYWKPKQRAEEQQIARELYDNGKEPLTEDQIPHRPTTASEMARSRAQSRMKADYGISNPAMEENQQSRMPASLMPSQIAGQMRPGTGQMRPGTGQMRPGTGQMRPGTGQMRPGTGQMRPGTGQMRPGTGQMRPGTGQMRPGTGQMRPGTGQMRPGTGQMGPRTGQMGSGKPSITSQTNHNEKVISDNPVEQTGWSQQIENLTVTQQTVKIVTRVKGQSLASLVGAGYTSQKETLPPLNLDAAEPIKVKKKKRKRNKEKPILEIEPEENDDTSTTTTPRFNGPGSSRPTSARPSSALKTSATAPGDLSSTKLPGVVRRPNDEDDWA